MGVTSQALLRIQTKAIRTAVLQAFITIIMSSPSMTTQNSQPCTCIELMLRASLGIVVIIFPFALPHIFSRLVIPRGYTGISNEDLWLLEESERHSNSVNTVEDPSALVQALQRLLPSAFFHTTVSTLQSETRDTDITHTVGIWPSQHASSSTVVMWYQNPNRETSTLRQTYISRLGVGELSPR